MVICQFKDLDKTKSDVYANDGFSACCNKAECQRQIGRAGVDYFKKRVGAPQDGKDFPELCAHPYEFTHYVDNSRNKFPKDSEKTTYGEEPSAQEFSCEKCGKEGLEVSAGVFHCYECSKDVCQDCASDLEKQTEDLSLEKNQKSLELLVQKYQDLKCFSCGLKDAGKMTICSYEPKDPSSAREGGNDAFVR